MVAGPRTPDRAAIAKGIKELNAMFQGEWKTSPVKSRRASLEHRTPPPSEAPVPVGLTSEMSPTLMTKATAIDASFGVLSFDSPVKEVVDDLTTAEFPSPSRAVQVDELLKKYSPQIEKEKEEEEAPSTMGVTSTATFDEFLAKQEMEANKRAKERLAQLLAREERSISVEKDEEEDHKEVGKEEEEEEEEQDYVSSPEEEEEEEGSHGYSDDSSPPPSDHEEETSEEHSENSSQGEGEGCIDECCSPERAHINVYDLLEEEEKSDAKSEEESSGKEEASDESSGKEEEEEAKPKVID